MAFPACCFTLKARSSNSSKALKKPSISPSPRSFATLATIAASFCSANRSPAGYSKTGLWASNRFPGGNSKITPTTSTSSAIALFQNAESQPFNSFALSAPPVNGNTPSPHLNLRGQRYKRIHTAELNETFGPAAHCDQSKIAIVKPSFGVHNTKTVEAHCTFLPAPGETKHNESNRIR
jgi:hypothetical protein